MILFGVAKIIMKHKELGLLFIDKTRPIRAFNERTKGLAWFIGVGLIIAVIVLAIIDKENPALSYMFLAIYYLAGRVVYNDIYDWIKKKLKLDEKQ
jgi:hypothetical protein